MKRFKVFINDWDYNPPCWEVWDNFCYARFYGLHAREYARNHARMLNSLPKEHRP